MFPKKSRISKKEPPGRFLDKLSSKHLSFLKKKNKLDENRFAVVVSKKIDKVSPHRNQMRRRIGNILRQFKSGGNDVIVIVTSSKVSTMPFLELKKEISEVFSKFINK